MRNPLDVWHLTWGPLCLTTEPGNSSWSADPSPGNQCCLPSNRTDPLRWWSRFLWNIFLRRLAAATLLMFRLRNQAQEGLSYCCQCCHVYIAELSFHHQDSSKILMSMTKLIRGRILMPSSQHQTSRGFNSVEILSETSPEAFLFWDCSVQFCSETSASLPPLWIFM